MKCTVRACLISVIRIWFFFFFCVRCRLVIWVVPTGRWTAPSGVGRWLFHGVFSWETFCWPGAFSFSFVERAWLQDMDCGLCFQSAGAKGWLFQCQSFSCGYVVCSGLFLAGTSWSVRGTIVSEGCFVGDYSLYFCAWSQLASCFWWACLLLGN